MASVDEEIAELMAQLEMKQYYILISFVASTKWELDEEWPHSDPRMGSTVPGGRPSRLTRTEMSVETTYRGHL